MLCPTVSVVDAFEEAVSRARDRLGDVEGSPVSWRELVRRAGFVDGDVGRVSYHLLPRERRRHHVPAWLIEALAPVLAPVISRTDLHRAAASAAGYSLEGASEDAALLVPMVTRVLDDDSLDDDERQRLGLAAIAAITHAMQRDRPRTAGGSGGSSDSGWRGRDRRHAARSGQLVSGS